MFKKSGMRTPSIAFETFLINIMFKFFSHLIMLQYLRSSWPTLGSQGVYFWRRAIITGSTLAANTARAQHRLIGRQTWAKAGASFSAQSQGSQDKPILGQDWPKRQHADWEDHQTWQELLDPKQNNNHTHFERPPLNSVYQKANIFVKSQNTSVTSLKYVQKQQIVVHSLFT